MLQIIDDSDADIVEMSKVQASGDSNEEGRTTRVLSADNADNVQNQIHQTTPTVVGVGRRDQLMSPSYISPVSSATTPTSAAIVDNYQEQHRQHHNPQHISATPQASSETRRSREVRNTIDSNVRKSSNGSNDAITTPVAQSFLVQQSYDSDASDGR